MTNLWFWLLGCSRAEKRISVSFQPLLMGPLLCDTNPVATKSLLLCWDGRTGSVPAMQSLSVCFMSDLCCNLLFG